MKRGKNVNNRQIEEILAKLKTELDAIEPLQGEQGQALESLKREVNHCLELSEEGSLHSLWQRLKESIETFEESHPGLTAAMSEAINILVSSGV
jgi:hypothetical protein